MAVTGKNIGEGGEYSGSYTPTADLLGVNLTSVTASVIFYKVAGDEITLTGSFNVDPIAIGEVEFTFLPPELCNFLQVFDVSGNMTAITSDILHARALVTEQKVRIVGQVTDTSPRDFYISITMRIR